MLAIILNIIFSLITIIVGIFAFRTFYLAFTDKEKDGLSIFLSVMLVIMFFMFVTLMLIANFVEF